MYDKAIEHLNRAIVLNPRYAVAYNNRGFTYTMLDKLDLALEDFNKAIGFDQSDSMVGVYLDRGNLYLRRGDNGLAISDFLKACKLGNNEGCGALRAAQSR